MKLTDFLKKLKDKGVIHGSIKLIAHGVNTLNGVIVTRNYKVPLTVLYYTPPETAKSYAKGEKIALWFTDIDYVMKQIEEQLNKNLKELTIWLDMDNAKLLKDFLNRVIK